MAASSTLIDDVTYYILAYLIQYILLHILHTNVMSDLASLEGLTSPTIH